MYHTKQFGDMPLLDLSASYDEANKIAAVFIVNRSQTESITVELNWQDIAPKGFGAVHQVAGTDPKSPMTMTILIGFALCQWPRRRLMAKLRP